MFNSSLSSLNVANKANTMRRYATLVCVILAVRLAHSQDVLTQGYDNSRSGAYTFETKLTTSAVAANFGKLYERNVDGDVQAQVLYARNVSVPGGSPKNLFFVATAKNRLYAFDADNNDPDPRSGVVWSRQINSTRQLIVGPTSAVSEICNETFNGWVGITSTPVIDRGSSTLYAVSWRPPLADMNLFTTSVAGAVQMSGWMGAAMGYHPWSVLSSDSFVIAGQPITALWRDAKHLDLFVIAVDGGIYTASWEADKGGQSWTWSRIGSTGIASPGQRVSAQWISPTQLDLFFIAPDGSVRTTTWESGTGWQNWIAIGPAGTAAPGQPVSTAVRGAHIDLFVTAPDGAVLTTWWESSSGWQTWFAVAGPPSAVPGSEVTVIPNGLSHLDLFVTSSSGTIESTWWEPTPGWHAWFAIGSTGVAPAGATVTALRNGTAHIDLFATGADGSVKTTWWEPTPGWHPWFSIGGAGTAVPGAIVTALWNGSTHLDIFATGIDGTVKTAWWEASPSWSTWSAVGTPSSTKATQLVTALWALPTHVTDIGGNYLHAIDIGTGLEKPFSPVKIQATAPNSPMVVLDPRCHRNRPALLLSNGVVYIGFSCLSCDRWCTSEPFRGWVVGYNASTLNQVAIFNTSPTKAAAGIWQSGSGLVSDLAGNIYFQTGNGEPANAASAPPLDDSFVKLTPIGSSPGLALAGYYSPPNGQALRCGDTDLGSGGPALLPGGMLLGGGKEGKLYLVNTGSMSEVQTFQAFSNTWHADPSQPPCKGPNPPWIACTPPFPPDPPNSNSSPSCYVAPSRYQEWQPFGPNIHGEPTIWTLQTKGYSLIYKMPEKDFLKAFKFDLNTHQITTSPVFTSPIKPPDGMPGGFSSISSNGEQDGIVWTIFPNGDGTTTSVPARFIAFDAMTLRPIWEDPEQDAFAKFTAPTVADGRVYKPTFAGMIGVYGLITPTVLTASAMEKRVVTNARGNPGWMTTTCHTIDQVYRRYGGPKGILGLPLGPEVILDGGTAAGRYREFRGYVIGVPISVHKAVAPSPQAQEEQEDKPPFLDREQVEASIYWSPATCAHVVLGDIRTLWRSIGAEKSSLGYPISDEFGTPDELGRRSQFQHGEIWWYPKQGAFVHEMQGK